MPETTRRAQVQNNAAARPTNPAAPFDALLLVSYGGPEGPEEVLPFMRNATFGAGIPDERLLEVSGHYQRFAGVSPLGACNRQLAADLGAELARRGAALPIEIGNRNWHPYFHESLHHLAAGGARRILTLFASAYTCYSGCRQYRENLAAAAAVVEQAWPGAPDADYAPPAQVADGLGAAFSGFTAEAPAAAPAPTPAPAPTGSGPADSAPAETPTSLDWSFARVRPFANTEGFVQANVNSLTRAWEKMQARSKNEAGPAAGTGPIHIAVVTHSIPINMALLSGAQSVPGDSLPANSTRATALPENQLKPAMFVGGVTPGADLSRRADAFHSPGSGANPSAVRTDSTSAGYTATVHSTSAAVPGTPAASGLTPAAMAGFLTETGAENLGQGWGYVAQHLAVAGEVIRRFRAAQGLSEEDTPWTLSFCSRSGQPQAKWLEPDINDHLQQLAAAGAQRVIALPLGFISDHMEVVFDLDTEAAQTAQDLGLDYVRAGTAGTDPALISTLADLVLERAAVARGENPDQPVASGTYPALGETCGQACCQYHPRHPTKGRHIKAHREAHQPDTNQPDAQKPGIHQPTAKHGGASAVQNPKPKNDELRPR